MFFHYGTRKISPICNISNFSEDLSFFNPQGQLNRDAAKIFAVSSRKIDKYEYLTGEEVLQEEKQIKSIKNRVKKNLDTDQKSIASLFSEHFSIEEAVYELNKIVEIENKLNRDDLINKTGNKKRIKHTISESLKQ